MVTDLCGTITAVDDTNSALDDNHVDLDNICPALDDRKISD